MSQTLFADAITNIIVTGPLVRLELSVVDTTVPRKGDEAVKLRVADYVVMPIDAFANAVAMQQNVVDKLVKDGVLKKREIAQAPKSVS